MEIVRSSILGQVRYLKFIFICHLFAFVAAAFAGEWIADSVSGCKLWNPNPTSGEAVEWSGTCRDSYAQGKGVLKWFLNGNLDIQYAGELLDGKRSGKGILTWSNGDSYDGDFFADIRTGKGLYIWAKGNRYEGEFLDGKPNGKGIFIWVNGERYEGDFLYGKRTGKGVYTWADGSRYEGEFMDGKFNGSPVTISEQRQKARVAICLTAEVPNPRPSPNESTAFYGDCQNGRADTGIVIWKIRGVPVNISCLDKGVYVSQETIDRFEACESYWSYVPNYCKAGSYSGQCSGGRPHGVGYETSRGSTISMTEGMFSDGRLNGYANRTSKSGCGRAGCSGNYLNEQGWFSDGVLVSSCSGFSSCFKNISGKPFTDFISQQKTPEQQQDLEKLRSSNDFESLLTAYTISGERNDLKLAQSLARTKSDNAQLELLALRVAGFDRAFDLQARIQNGGKSIPLSDSDHLLGFVRGVDSRFPVKVLWTLKPKASGLKLQYGSYKIGLTVGLNAETSTTTCVFGFCSSLKDVDRYVQTRSTFLQRENRFQESGEYDLNVSGSSTNVIFGIHSGSTLTGITPVIRIDSIELQ